jgi:membrane protein DedA with SNARE-associated domain
VINQLESYFIGTKSIVLGQPVLFVLLMGLFIAIYSVTGEIFTYWAARLGGPALIARLATWGWLRMDSHRMQRTENLFSRWGVRLVMFGRIIPGLRTLVSVPAGLTHMNFGMFLGAAFSSAYIWNTLLVGIGYALGFKVTLLGFSILG